MAAYDPEEAPLDPAAERLRRKMARLVVISSGIMVLGLIAVFAALVYKLGMLGPNARSAPTSAGEPFGEGVVEAPIALPPRARLIAADLDGNRALLTVETDGVSSLVLVDLASGSILGRYPLRSE